MNAVHITTDVGGARPIPQASPPAPSSQLVSRILESLATRDRHSIALLYQYHPHDSLWKLAEIHPTESAPLFPGQIDLEATTGDSTLHPGIIVKDSIRADIDSLPALRRQGLALDLVEPICSESGRLLGMLCLVGHHEASPTPGTLDLVQVLIPCLANVLEHEHTFETAWKDSQLVGLLQLLAESTTRTVELRAILQSIANLALRVESCEACAVFIREQRQPRFRIQGFASTGNCHVEEVPETLTIEGIPASCGACQIQLDSSPAYDTGNINGRSHAVLVAPAFAESRNVGLILVIDHERREYTADDRM